MASTRACLDGGAPTQSSVSVRINVPHYLRSGTVPKIQGKPKAHLPAFLQPYAGMEQVVPVLRDYLTSTTCAKSDSKLLLPSSLGFIQSFVLGAGYVED